MLVGNAKRETNYPHQGGGSVQWPRGNKTHALRKSWRQFAEILTRHMTGILCGRVGFAS
jgi:hypothetical protein